MLGPLRFRGPLHKTPTHRRRRIPPPSLGVKVLRPVATVLEGTDTCLRIRTKPFSQKRLFLHYMAWLNTPSDSILFKKLYSAFELLEILNPSLSGPRFSLCLNPERESVIGNWSVFRRWVCRRRPRRWRRRGWRRGLSTRIPTTSNLGIPGGLYTRAFRVSSWSSPGLCRALLWA